MIKFRLRGWYELQLARGDRARPAIDYGDFVYSLGLLPPPPPIPTTTTPPQLLHLFFNEMRMSFWIRNERGLEGKKLRENSTLGQKSEVGGKGV